MYKKGVSSVVTTVLIILLVLAAVAMIGGILLKNIQETADKIEAGFLNERVPCYRQFEKEWECLMGVSADAEPGIYKLKVIINRNSQKTSSELTEDVAVAVSEKSQTVQALGSLVQPDSEISAEQQPIQRIAARNGIIYESSTQKAGKIAVAIFVFLLASLAIILLIKKA